MTTTAVGEAVVAALAAVLERDPATDLPADRPLADLGVDSLVRVEVAERVEAALGGAVVISDEDLDAAHTLEELSRGFRPSGARR